MAARINKKELEEPDKLQLLFLSIRAFAEKNRKRIYAGGIAVFVIVALAGGWYLYQLNYEVSAAKLYARVFENAIKAVGNAGDDAAVKGYKDLVAQYPRSQAALTAYLKLGNVYFNRHEVDTAIGYYEDFLKKSPEESDLLSLVYNSLACCYEVKKDYSKAMELFEKALKANTTSTFAAINYSGIARIYEARNDSAKAAEFYRKALEKTTDPVMMVYLKRKISTLG